MPERSPRAGRAEKSSPPRQMGPSSEKRGNPLSSQELAELTSHYPEGERVRAQDGREGVMGPVSLAGFWTLFAPDGHRYLMGPEDQFVRLEERHSSAPLQHTVPVPPEGDKLNS